MMKLIAPALIAGVFGAAGGAAAVYLKSGSSAPAAAASHGDKGAAEAKEDKGHGDKPKKDAHGDDKKGHGSKAKGGHGSASGEGVPTYYKFSREFVVPIVGTERVKSLVILNLNLEVDESASQDLFSREPALRDNIMTALISLSADDEIFNSLNSIEHYETIRSMILANLQNSFGEGVKNVLILDMARQDL
ncbi:flagellar basal body-associated FliL family protein [Henriciella sp.]|uniref:flagellar basal body-associated FliL family protein n=1 Tax=Henriciella sp. TaxID=1968823 RepID=UPI002608C7C2|nr:flagellar basal body-associated FliL family protein [Henriciella sp.]